MFGNDMISVFTVLTWLNLNSSKHFFFFFNKSMIVVNSVYNVGIHGPSYLDYLMCNGLGNRNNGSCRGISLTCWYEKSTWLGV